MSAFSAKWQLAAREMCGIYRECGMDE